MTRKPYLLSLSVACIAALAAHATAGDWGVSVNVGSSPQYYGTSYSTGSYSVEYAPPVYGSSSVVYYGSTPTYYGTTTTYYAPTYTPTPTYYGGTYIQYGPEPVYYDNYDRNVVVVERAPRVVYRRTVTPRTVVYRDCARRPTYSSTKTCYTRSYDSGRRHNVSYTRSCQPTHSRSHYTIGRSHSSSSRDQRSHSPRHSSQHSSSRRTYGRSHHRP